MKVMPKILKDAKVSRGIRSMHGGGATTLRKALEKQIEGVVTWLGMVDAWQTPGKLSYHRATTDVKQ